MTKTLIAKPVVDNTFWIVTDGKEKVGNVISNGSGFEVKLNGSVSYFENTKSIQTKAHIKFESKKVSKTKQEIPLPVYPTSGKTYNSMMDIKRKLHLYTKTAKSKCYYAAGWFAMDQGTEKAVVLCPKYIFVQRYTYLGPYKTKTEADHAINN